jgi:hypothetical protein
MRDRTRELTGASLDLPPPAEDHLSMHACSFRCRPALLLVASLAVSAAFLLGPAGCSSTTGGGAGGNGTSHGSTGSSTGGCGECFRAIQCVKMCGGPVVQSGCCPCPAGTFDDITCMDAGPEDAGEGG